MSILHLLYTSYRSSTLTPSDLLLFPQFAFLYDGWDNKWSPSQLKIGLGFLAFGGILLLAFAPSFAFVGASLGETLFGLNAISFGLGAGGTPTEPYSLYANTSPSPVPNPIALKPPNPKKP
jgi:hypothetical protein